MVSQSKGVPRSPGQSAPAQQAREQLEEADHLRQRGQLDRAQSICYSLTRRHPGYVAALHTLGLVYLDKQNFERALDCLVRAQMLEPGNWMTLTALSLAYLRLGASEMAIQTLHHAVAIRPSDASILASLGEIYRDEREYELALDAYRKALTQDAGLETAEIGLATCLSALGRFCEAATVLQGAYRRGHSSLNLLHVMTTLPSTMIKINLLAALDLLAAKQQEQNEEFKNTFAFVRAAALHMVGRHAEAWRHLEMANRPIAVACQPELKAEVERREKSLARVYNTLFKPIRSSANEPTSVFIFGPSRSGKSSLEHLLASLNGVKAGYEASLVENSLRLTFQSAALPTSRYLEDLPPELHASFRDYYLKDLLRRARSARILTSTLASRIHDAGIIASVIPNVRFVLVRRNLQDTAFRIYMAKYLRGNAYAYDLKSITANLEWYHGMMDLVAEKFPEVTVTVTYKNMLDDPRAAVRRVADLCGLFVPDNLMLELVVEPQQVVLG